MLKNKSPLFKLITSAVVLSCGLTLSACADSPNNSSSNNSASDPVDPEVTASAAKEIEKIKQDWEEQQQKEKEESARLYMMSVVRGVVALGYTGQAANDIANHVAKNTAHKDFYQEMLDYYDLDEDEIDHVSLALFNCVYNLRDPEEGFVVHARTFPFAAEILPELKGRYDKFYAEYDAITKQLKQLPQDDMGAATYDVLLKKREDYKVNYMIELIKDQPVILTDFANEYNLSIEIDGELHGLPLSQEVYEKATSAELAKRYRNQP